MLDPIFFSHMAAKSAYFLWNWIAFAEGNFSRNLLTSEAFDPVRLRQFSRNRLQPTHATNWPWHPSVTANWARHTGRRILGASEIWPVYDLLSKSFANTIYYIYIDIGPMLRSAISQRSRNWGPDGCLTSPTCSHLPLRLWSLDMMSALVEGMWAYCTTRVSQADV